METSLERNRTDTKRRTEFLVKMLLEDVDKSQYLNALASLNDLMALIVKSLSIELKNNRGSN